jgi:hypothetical protein
VIAAPIGSCWPGPLVTRGERVEGNPVFPNRSTEQCVVFKNRYAAHDVVGAN